MRTLVPSSVASPFRLAILGSLLARLSSSIEPCCAQLSDPPRPSLARFASRPCCAITTTTSTTTSTADSSSSSIRSSPLIRSIRPPPQGRHKDTDLHIASPNTPPRFWLRRLRSPQTMFSRGLRQAITRRVVGFRLKIKIREQLSILVAFTAVTAVGILSLIFVRSPRKKEEKKPERSSSSRNVAVQGC